MRTAVIAVAKLENNYIREWTEWYKNLGFTNVIIYDNNDYGDERIVDAIRDHFDSGFAIIKPLHNVKDAQYRAYENGYKEFGQNYDWIAFFDIDEFLVLSERFHNNIEEFLSMGCFDGRDLIRVTWRHYSDSGLLRVVDGDYSVMKRFTKLSKQQHNWTKAIVKGGIPDFELCGTSDGIPHIVKAKGIKNAVDANGIPVDNKSIRNGCGYENAALNHYSTKTIEEFVLLKIKRGYPLVCLDPKILNMDYFFSQNEKTKEKEDLYNELISKLKTKKYSILTYNIGGYEILHEVEKPLGDCEYVYVTDDRTITSATWNVVYVENKHPEDNFDLCYTIRFNPFDYVSTDVVIRVDGTTTPCGNTDEIYQTFMGGDYDIGLFIHPERYRFDEELSIWEKYRNYSHEQTERVLSYVRENGYDVEHYLGIFQGNMMIHKNTELNREICEKTLKILKEIHDDGKLIDRLDQVIFTYVVNKFHPDIKVLPLGDNILNGSYFNMYWHGSNNKIPVRVTSNKKYMFNKEVTPFVFKDCKLQNDVLAEALKTTVNNVDFFVITHKNFETKRTNPIFKIVCSETDNVTSDKLKVIKVKPTLANDGWSEWQKIYEIYKGQAGPLKDYVGLCHYHRYIDFGGDVNMVPPMDVLFSNADVSICNVVEVPSVRENYAICHNVEDFDLCMEIIKDKFPEYSSSFDVTSHCNKLFAGNTLILRRDDFYSMCEFVFGVLFEYCKRVGIDPCSNESFHDYVNKHIEKYNKKHYIDDDSFKQQARIPAFLSERLLTIWVIGKCNKVRIFNMRED